MKRFLSFVSACNQVLLFFGLLAALGLAAYGLYEEFRPFRPEGVPIQPPSAAPEPAPVTGVSFIARSHGMLLFGITRDFVSGPQEIASRAGLTMSSSSYVSHSFYLNVVFSDGSAVRRTLLPHDGIVVRHDIASADPTSGEFSAHAFLCVLTDTNNDRQLSPDDAQTLRVVRPDLSGEDLVIENTRNFRSLSRDELLVETGVGEDTRFWIVDAATFGRREVAWK